jgi:hypothetical protein
MPEEKLFVVLDMETEDFIGSICTDCYGEVITEKAADKKVAKAEIKEAVDHIRHWAREDSQARAAVGGMEKDVKSRLDIILDFLNDL